MNSDQIYVTAYRPCMRNRLNYMSYIYSPLKGTETDEDITLAMVSAKKIRVRRIYSAFFNGCCRHVGYAYINRKGNYIYCLLT